ncbi:TPA: O-antigen polymerase, partial [Streptococcus suis]
MLLLIVFFFISIVALYWLHKKDIMSPSIVLCAVYLLCVLFAISNWDLWHLETYSKEASTLIIIAIVTFSITGLICSRVVLYRRKEIIMEDTNKTKITEIKMSNIFILLNFIVCSFAIAWLNSITLGTSGAIGLSEAMTTQIAIPFVLNVLGRYVRIQGYFFGFVLVNNVNTRKFILRDLWLVIFVSLTALQSLVSGSRMEIIKIIAFLLIASYILWHKKNGWDRNISFKYIRIGTITLVVFFVLFYQMRYFKVGDSSGYSPLYYISLYIGAPIKLLDLYLTNPIAPSSLFGQETFTTFNTNLASLGIIEHSVERHLEFRGIGSLGLGNVYGAIRRYYQDFGLMGMIILVGGMSFIFHKAYYSIRNDKSNLVDFKSILYCYIFTVIPMFPIDDIFYSELSIGYLINIALLYILYLIFIK